MSDPNAVISNQSKHDSKWIVSMLIAISIGLIVVASIGLSNEAFGRWPALFGGLLLSGTAIFSGGFFGFLFGIPRSKQVQTSPAGNSAGAGREYSENTNLEQISDWLTKIIIGLTLIQFREISEFIWNSGEKFGPVLISGGVNGVSSSIATAVILYFFIVGFLFSYLLTRIYMESLLKRQHALLSSELEQLINDVQEIQGDTDAEILEIVDSFLDKNAEVNAKKFKNINERIKSASLIARTMIFRMARKVRRNNWRDDGDRELVGRASQVFRGLVAAAPRKYHRNYGQLGYALIKQTEPDWEGAKSALQTAIRLRGPQEDSGSGYYEFNLALALINLDVGFHGGNGSDEDTKKRIADLLAAGGKVIDLKTDDDIVKWAELNGHDIDHPPD